MGPRHYINLVQRVAVAVHCTIWCRAQVVASECWTSSNGDEICSGDPTGLRATWWFFFVLLLFVSIASGCFDADWWPQEQPTPDAQAARLERGLLDDDKELSVSLVHPLLGGHESIPSPPKPVYRYLDP
ncbi:hypothetical protein PHYPSEUDO_000675 [Phytophthora pseudosyringae]|uniref:Uncharacterized protein n=1 Tax=Phytophthora pseudosyringae TaxID=221518 RepID=A0A8T1W1S9_9STRA|nr:hypothetical protein PHYPSEUDO_000675 [Phytophthora pseudosyringae]